MGGVDVGVGITGDRKKVSTSQAGGGFEAYDRLRPAEILTLDLRYNEDRAYRLLDPRGVLWQPSDVASDPDNNWADAAVVDAHVHMGFTYDYLAAHHGWNGMDGKNGRMLGMVNIGRDYHSAFFAHPPAGPEGTGVVAFGREENGTPIVSADVDAHEMMHGVTYFSVKERTGQPLLDRIGYIRGPKAFRHEDGRTLRCGRTYVWFREPHPLAGRRFYYLCDRDGRYQLFMNHGGAINEAYSDIMSGVDGANRGDVERVFFRAMTELMPASVGLHEAAPVIRQSAIDLFGAGSATYRAVDQGLEAVGF